MAASDCCGRCRAGIRFLWGNSISDLCEAIEREAGRKEPLCLTTPPPTQRSYPYELCHLPFLIFDTIDGRPRAIFASKAIIFGLFYDLTCERTFRYIQQAYGQVWDATAPSRASSAWLPARKLRLPACQLDWAAAPAALPPAQPACRHDIPLEVNF